MPGAPKPDRRAKLASWIGVAVLVAGGYWLYTLWKPLTPVQVCERINEAKTAAEAKRYAVPSFHPALDAIYAQPDATSESDDTGITGDGPAPAGVGGHFVGMTGTVFIPEFGRRVRFEVVVHLVEHDGWKVNDLIYLTFDGRVIDPPLSVAANYRELFNLPPAGGGAKPAVGTKSTPAAPPARQWYDNRQTAFLAGKGLLGFIKAGGVKAIGVGILAVGGGLYALYRWVTRIRISVRPESSGPHSR
jgi:hypothetical protein